MDSKINTGVADDQRQAVSDIQIPEFLQKGNVPVGEGCGDVITTVKQEVPQEMQDKLNSIRNGEKVVTENDVDKIKATVNQWTTQEKLIVLKNIEPNLLMQTISGYLRELQNMKSDLQLLTKKHAEE